MRLALLLIGAGRLLSAGRAVSLAAAFLLPTPNEVRSGEAVPMIVGRDARGNVVPVDPSVRGLRIDRGSVRFNGIEIRRRERRDPVQNGGYPLDKRSASADVLKPQEERVVIRRFQSEYGLPP